MIFKISKKDIVLPFPYGRIRPEGADPPQHGIPFDAGKLARQVIPIAPYSQPEPSRGHNELTHNANLAPDNQARKDSHPY